MQFRRNQDFYISSNVQLNCTQSFSITTKWTILNYLNQVQLLETTLNDLLILARTLSIGLYELQLTVTIIDIPQLTSSSSVYIEIIQSIIMTNLVLYDTPMIKHDYQQNLILNPGEFSIDLNGIIFNTNVSYLF